MCFGPVRADDYVRKLDAEHDRRLGKRWKGVQEDLKVQVARFRPWVALDGGSHGEWYSRREWTKWGKPRLFSLFAPG